jgi:hypothetical protein
MAMMSMTLMPIAKMHSSPFEVVSQLGRFESDTHQSLQNSA